MLKPESSTSFLINLAGLVSFLSVFCGLYIWQPTWPIEFKLLSLLASAVVTIIVLESLFKPPPIWRIMWAMHFIHKANIQRVLIKLLALYSIYAAIAFIYWLVPEYQGSFYQPFWNVLYPLLSGLIGLTIPYFYVVDAIMANNHKHDNSAAEDSYYQLGSLLLGNYQHVDRQQIYQLLLGWLVKLFFMPLMFVYLTNNISSMLGGGYSWQSITQSFQSGFDFLWILLFTIDLAFVSFGYALTLRLLDSHIRSTENTALGWGAALICYQPFWSIVSGMYFAYNLDHFSWGQWLENSPVLYMVWGCLIMLLILLYTLSSVAFGIRFSNLTHRGIITNGPYRWLKHPAYVAKNASYWLIAIPFISPGNDFKQIVQACFMLLCLNAVYFIRAKTEERHLLHDPIYQQYSQWIAQHGLFAKLKRGLSQLVKIIINSDTDFKGKHHV